MLQTVNDSRSELLQGIIDDGGDYHTVYKYASRSLCVSRT